MKRSLNSVFRREELGLVTSTGSGKKQKKKVRGEKRKRRLPKKRGGSTRNAIGKGKGETELQMTGSFRQELETFSSGVWTLPTGPSVL